MVAGGLGGGTDFPIGEVKPVPDEPEVPEAGVVPGAVVVDGPGPVAEPVGVLGGPVELVGVPGSCLTAADRYRESSTPDAPADHSGLQCMPVFRPGAILHTTIAYSSTTVVASKPVPTMRYR